MLTVRKVWFGFMALVLALSLSACAGSRDGVSHPRPLETIVTIDGDCE